MLISHDFARMIGNWLAGGTMPQPPTSLRLAYIQQMDGAAGTGIVEANPPYARQPLVLTAPWSDGENGTFCWNANDISFTDDGEKDGNYVDCGLVRYTAVFGVMPSGDSIMLFFAPWSDPPGDGIHVTRGGVNEGELPLSLCDTNFSNSFAEGLFRWMAGDGGTMFASHASVHLALSSTPILKDGSGLTEPSDGAYKRPAVRFCDPKVRGNAVVLEGRNDIVFPPASAPWDGLGFWSICNGANGGPIMSGSLGTIVNVPVGESRRVLTGVMAGDDRPVPAPFAEEITQRCFRIPKNQFSIVLSSEPARTASGMLL